MSFLTKVGAFNTGTGAAASTVVVSGVGFQPKAIIFWWSGLTGTVDVFTEGDARRGIGVATSPTSRWAIGTQQEDASASSDTDRIQREDACIATLTIVGAVEGLMDLQSMDTDGFTLVVDDAFPSSYRVHYMALGGNDLTDVKTGRWDVPAATGNEDISGVGFQPDFVLFGSTNFQTDPPSLTTGADIMVGAAVSSSQQAVLFSRDLHNQPTMDTFGYCLAGECIGMGTGPNIRATFVSFLPDGFRVNWLEVVATPITFYLALKGGSYAIGDFLTSTSNGATIAESGLGFQPKGTMLFSHGRAQDTANALSAVDHWNIGGFTSTTERGAQGAFSDDNVANAFIQFYVEHDAALAQITNAPSEVGLVDVQSIDADGFTLVMDSAANPAAFVWYVSFGDEPSSPQTLTGALFTKAPTFNTGAVTSTYNLVGVFKSFTPAFKVGGISSVRNLDGVLFQKAPTFPQGSFSAGAVNLSGTLFQKAPTFFAGGVVQSQALAGVLFTKAPTFSTGTVVVGAAVLGGVLYQNTPTFSQGAVTSTVNLAGVLYQNTPVFSTGTVAAGAVNLAGDLFESVPTFNAGVLSQQGGPQLLGGTLFQKAPTFPQGSVTTGAVALTGVLFQRAPTFFTGAVASVTNLAGVLFQKAPTFLQGEVIGAQLLEGVLFQRSPAFPTGSVGVAGAIDGVLFVKSPTFFTGSLGQLGGSFWRPNPAGYTLNPAAFDPVLRNEVPPWAIEVHGEDFELDPVFFAGAVS